MARRGKPSGTESSIQIKVYVPASLWLMIKMEVWDPLLQRPGYGRVNALIVRLLRQYFEEKKDG